MFGVKETLLRARRQVAGWRSVHASLILMDANNSQYWVGDESATGVAADAPLLAMCLGLGKE